MRDLRYATIVIPLTVNPFTGSSRGEGFGRETCRRDFSARLFGETFRRDFSTRLFDETFRRAQVESLKSSRSAERLWWTSTLSEGIGAGRKSQLGERGRGGGGQVIKRVLYLRATSQGLVSFSSSFY